MRPVKIIKNVLYRRPKRTVLLLSIAISCFLVIFACFRIQRGFNDQPYKGENYLDSQIRKHIFDNGFVVKTSKCRIPKLSAWNKDFLPSLEVVSASDKVKCVSAETPEQMKKSFGNLTLTRLVYVKAQLMYLNESALEPLGLTLKDISCSYQLIERVTQNVTNYNTFADRRFRYSSVSYPIFNATTPAGSFIRVTCNVKHGHFAKTEIYRGFHLVAKFTENDQKINEKLQFWRNKTTELPPNVLVLVLDSTSALNFRRQMPFTSHFLSYTLRAVEMKGYTKVGVNSFPNFIPLFTGHFIQELACMKNFWFGESWQLRTPLDDCPFLWDAFSKANYITALIEDAPNWSLCNYLKTGFVRQPVDIYLRPWAVAVFENDQEQCIDGQRHEPVLLQYIVDLAKLAKDRGAPYMFLGWFTILTHYSLNNQQVMDGYLVKALTVMHEMGLLDNTVLLVLGDHGVPFYTFRQTVTGWYEDKMPALWIKLPKSVKRTQPQWPKALLHNSHMLSSPFDVHQTIKSILNVNNPTLGLVQNYGSRTGLRGLSLFETLQDRCCDEAGIPIQFCPCMPIQPYNGTMSLLTRAVNIVVNLMNYNFSSTNCTQIGVRRITGAAILQKQQPNKFNSSTLGSRVCGARASDQENILIVGMNTLPNNYFDAYFMYNEEMNSITVVNESLPYYLFRYRNCVM